MVRCPRWIGRPAEPLPSACRDAVYVPAHQKPLHGGHHMKWNGHKRPYSEKTFGNLTNRATVDSPEFKQLPLTAQILFIRLCDLRSRFNVGKNWTDDGAFFRSNEDLVKDTGFNEKTVVRAKKNPHQKRIHFCHAYTTSPLHHPRQPLWQNEKQRKRGKP